MEHFLTRDLSLVHAMAAVTANMRLIDRMLPTIPLMREGLRNLFSSFCGAVKELFLFVSCLLGTSTEN